MLSIRVEFTSLLNYCQHEKFETGKTSIVNFETDNNLFCITEFNPLNPPIREGIHELWPILHRSLGTRMLVGK